MTIRLCRQLNAKILSTQYYKHPSSFNLESGHSLNNLTLAYHTFGKLNKDKSNVVWVCHALTANSDAEAWWPGLIGEGKTIDTTKYFVVCANMPGSCYGSTGPTSVNPESGLKYRDTFPLITTRDMVMAYRQLADYLGINRIFCCIGGSTGGMQVLEWGIIDPKKFHHLVLMACNAQHSAWGIAFNESQRMALLSDHTIYDELHPQSGHKGLEAARSIAMLSYRHYNVYHREQTDKDFPLDNFRAASYQRYQGLKLQKRFDPWSYYFLSKAMDAHNVGRGRTSVKQALESVQARATIIGIDNDILFPFEEQKFMAEWINDSSVYQVNSIFGHDAFLMEYDQLDQILRGVFT